jgi:hypothetical protein
VAVDINFISSPNFFSHPFSQKKENSFNVKPETSVERGWTTHLLPNVMLGYTFFVTKLQTQLWIQNYTPQLLTN